MFPDTDQWFGSYGSFFNWRPTTGYVRSSVIVAISTLVQWITEVFTYHLARWIHV